MPYYLLLLYYLYLRAKIFKKYKSYPHITFSLLEFMYLENVFWDVNDILYYEHFQHKLMEIVSSKN